MISLRRPARRRWHGCCSYCRITGIGGRRLSRSGTSINGPDGHGAHRFDHEFEAQDQPGPILLLGQGARRVALPHGDSRSSPARSRRSCRQPSSSSASTRRSIASGSPARRCATCSAWSCAAPTSSMAGRRSDRLSLIRHFAALTKQGAVETIHMEAAPVARASTPFEVLLLPLRHTDRDHRPRAWRLLATRPAALARRVAAHRQAHHRPRTRLAGRRPQIRERSRARRRARDAARRATRASCAPSAASSASSKGASAAVTTPTRPDAQHPRDSSGAPSFCGRLTCDAYRNDAAISRSLSPIPA